MEFPTDAGIGSDYTSDDEKRTPLEAGGIINMLRVSESHATNKCNVEITEKSHERHSSVVNTPAAVIERDVQDDYPENFPCTSRTELLNEDDFANASKCVGVPVQTLSCWGGDRSGRVEGERRGGGGEGQGVKLVVWNKDSTKRSKKSQGSISKRFTPSDTDRTFFRVKVPSAQDLKHKEQGAKSSRCLPDTISNSSKTIKKGRRITSLQHVDYKKFLQCYVHVQELKHSKVDAVFSRNKFLEPTSVATTTRRRRAKAGPRPPKAPKMDEGFAECVAGLEQMADAGNNTEESELTPTTATLGLVQDFQANILIDPSNPEEAFTVDLGGIDDVANFEQVDLVDTFHISSSPPRRNEFGSVEISFDETGKPRCTYTDLIEKALSENGGLTVSEIYQWISDHFPYFQPDDDRWKNSVRHNLSINPYFSKGEKARSGAGHLWTISEESRALRPALRKKDFEYEDLAMCIENDTDRAVANILGQYHLAKNNMEGKPTRPNKNHESDSLCTPPPPQPPKHVQLPSGNDTGGTANDEFMEVSPVVIEYESNGFPGTEYTIDLSQFQFPDASGLSFDDLMPGGLIVIQTDDQDANKENVDHVRSVDAMGTEYLMTQQLDYSAIRHESSHITETERVSGQLISEAMTHDFDMHKDKCELNSIHQLEQSNCAEEEQHQVMREEQDNQQQNEISPSENTQEYLTLDSIDQLALQEVIHGNSNSETSIHHYQMMNVADYEPNKDIIGGYCTFAT